MKSTELSGLPDLNVVTPTPRKDRIRDLERRIREAEIEERDSNQIAQDLNKQIQQLNKKSSDARNTLRQLRKELSNLIPQEVEVSDHAVLRYLERHYGVDIEGARREIKQRFSGAENLGELQVQGFIVKNNVVTTYLPENRHGAWY